jgi:hypothetical protein
VGLLELIDDIVKGARNQDLTEDERALMRKTWELGGREGVVKPYAALDEGEKNQLELVFIAGINYGLGRAQQILVREIARDCLDKALRGATVVTGCGSSAVYTSDSRCFALGLSDWPR